MTSLPSRPTVLEDIISAAVVIDSARRLVAKHDGLLDLTAIESERGKNASELLTAIDIARDAVTRNVSVMLDTLIQLLALYSALPLED